MEFGVWNLGFGIWGLESGVWNLGFGIWGLESGGWNLEFGIWGLEFGVCNLGFVIWGFEFGVWNSGFIFGVYNLGFGMQDMRYTDPCYLLCRGIAHEVCAHHPTLEFGFEGSGSRVWRFRRFKIEI